MQQGAEDGYPEAWDRPDGRRLIGPLLVADMTRGVLILAALLVANCATHPMPSAQGVELPTLSIDRGTAADFGTTLPLCVRATDMTSGDDLGRAVAAAIAVHIPGLVFSCDEPGDRLVLTFQVSFSEYTHSSQAGPRFGFSHLATEHFGRGFYAEATMWDKAGGSSEELMKRAAAVVSAFIKWARSQIPPSARLQPATAGVILGRRG